MKCNHCGNEFNGSFCPVCGAQSGVGGNVYQQPMPIMQVKKKKPFYLRWWFILLAIIVVGIVYICLRFPEEEVDTKAEKFEWTDIELNEIIPKPANTYGDISRNSKSGLTVSLYDVDEKTYKSYREECIDKGFTIDSEESDTAYSAYNDEGYSIRLTFSSYNQEMSVTLDEPEKMSEFEWPTYGLGTHLPTPKSNIGKISCDNSDSYIVHIGNMTIDDYSEYVKICMDQGFTVDYRKDDDYYSAKNGGGYKLTLSYLGFNKIEISLRAPEGGETTPPTTVSTEKETPKEEHSGLDPDFKAAMDSYESYMYEYVAFMKKYQNNPNDPGLMSDYVTHLSKYTEFAEAFAKWEKTEMNDAEMAYYLEVQSRVNKKLLEIAG